VSGKTGEAQTSLPRLPLRLQLQPVNGLAGRATREPKQFFANPQRDTRAVPYCARRQSISDPASVKLSLLRSIREISLMTA